MNIFSSVGKKVLMGLTGLLLSLFLVVHALGNSTTFLGGKFFNSYAENLHKLGIFINFFEVGLVVVFLAHITLGVTLFLQNIQSRPTRYHINKSSGARTPGSRTMPYTGILILVFIIVHLTNFHFTQNSGSTAAMVKTVLSQPLYASFYILSMIALALHTSHGFWSLFQSFGINHPKYNSLLFNSSVTLSLIISVVFLMIPLCAMLLADFLL